MLAIAKRDVKRRKNPLSTSGPKPLKIPSSCLPRADRACMARAVIIDDELKMSGVWSPRHANKSHRVFPSFLYLPRPVHTPTAQPQRCRRDGLPSTRTRVRACGSRPPQPRDQSLHRSNEYIPSTQYAVPKNPFFPTTRLAEFVTFLCAVSQPL